MLKTLQKNFRVRPLTAAVASVISLTAGSFAHAQDGAEEIIVTGIKASLQQAMDIKRDAIGVVDAISAEDMGKFPDTNLAESLQRITGVSIDRSNGEGSRITVRGFGGDNNLLTLNGRMMPTATAYGGGSGAGGTYIGGATRSFDFSNLASESVSGVEVYKTGRASVATGGIGASVNIKTAKPLDHEGLKASVGVKALSDSTNEAGSDITPEISGLVSWSDAEGKFGVGVTASHQERDSGNDSIIENNWNIAAWNSSALPPTNAGVYSFAPNVVIQNQPREGQLYGRPNDIRYAHSDFERVRDNAQVTLQWAPTDKIKTTLDYTYAQNDITERRGEITSWLAQNNSIDYVIFDNKSTVAAPLYIHETAGPRDNGFEQALRKQENTLKGIGFNLEFKATDALTLTFDAHNSTLDSLPVGPGNSGEIAATFGTPTQTSHAYDFSGGTPIFTVVNNDGIKGANGQYRGNNNGVVDAGDIGSQVVRVFFADQTSEVDQYKLDGSYKFDDGQFDFGVESRSVEMHARNSNRYMAMGDWGIATVGDVPTSLVKPYNYADFDSLNASKSFQGGFIGPAEKIAASLVKTYGTAANGYCVCYNPVMSQNDSVKEDVEAAYFQVGVKGELGGMKTNFLVGLRYETTDVDSTSLVLPPDYILWQDNDDTTPHYPTGVSPSPLSVKASYDNLLPSFDFDIAITDDFKARFSASQTIARPPYGNLSAAVGNYSGGGGPTYNPGHIRTARSSNPALIPLLSTNFDISAEWYYDTSSYISAGVFEKRVTNFIGTEAVTRTLFGIKDQSSANSPRIQAAVAALQSAGLGVNDTSLFTAVAVLDNPTAFPTGINAYKAAAANAVTREQFEQAVGRDYDVIPRADDPLTQFQVTQYVNSREAKLHGAEFALQHFFGESGFGLQANYTIVRGDVAFDDGLLFAGGSQFSLLGLSDTANLVGIYEKDGWQARVAFNWRDQFLSNNDRGANHNPVYTEAYYQIDANVSYELTENLTLSVEGLNLTGEDRRDHGRNIHMVEFMEDLGPRYTVGARYNF